MTAQAEGERGEGVGRGPVLGWAHSGEGEYTGYLLYFPFPRKVKNTIILVCMMYYIRSKYYIHSVILEIKVMALYSYVSNVYKFAKCKLGGILERRTKPIIC